MQVEAAVRSTWKWTRGEVGAACVKWASFLRNVPAGLDPVQLMWAFALNESIHEKGGLLSCPPRFEPGYYFGGKYCKPGTLQYELCERFGKDGSKSYGPWQVMLCNTGFKPEEFTRLDTGAQAFVGYLNNMIATQKPTSRSERDALEQMADAYNSGNFRDRIVPVEYIARLKKHYYQDVLG